jgi:hypothetical protein
MNYFENISTEDLQILETAVPQIALLIAGADGKIDEEETAWAKKLTHIRSFSGDKYLKGFYEQVEANFSIKFRDMLRALPQNTAERQAALSVEIAKVNDVLAKLDSEIAFHLYKSYLSFAESIAKSSGGFLGFSTISNDEKKWIGLSMIHPIADPNPNRAEAAAEA